KCRAQDFLCVSIDQDFHEALRLALFECSGHILHGDLADQCAAATCSNVRCRHAGSAQWRIGVERIGRNAITHPPMLATEQIGGDNLVIVPGSVSEGTSAVA